MKYEMEIKREDGVLIFREHIGTLDDPKTKKPVASFSMNIGYPILVVNMEKPHKGQYTVDLGPIIHYIVEENVREAENDKSRKT